MWCSWGAKRRKGKSRGKAEVKVCLESGDQKGSGVEESSIFLCNTGKSVGCPLESTKHAQKYLALVTRGDGEGGGSSLWRWSHSDNSAERLVTLPM